MSESLNIIVGAGFSYYAGLPLGNDVKAKFDQPFRDRILKASSSEWMWTETQSAAMVNNGRLNSDHLTYSFILEEIVKAYKSSNNNQFADYEDFYQYVKDNTPIDGWYEGIIASAKKRFYLETDIKEDNEFYSYAFRYPERYMPQEIINYLIADLLGIRKTKEELIESYKPFIDYIQKYESVNIFSLNHDRVFECLFRLFGIDYCDGFSTHNSNIQYQDKPLLSFQNDFNSSRVKLVKLHGSIDMYLYEHGTEDGNTLTRTGEYTHFKPMGYHEKHHAVRVNPTTGDIVQSMNFDIIPKFITGKNKKAFIQSDFMYSEMFDLYKQRMGSVDDLLIVGYSYGDSHVNDELIKYSETVGPNIINLNYGDRYPFLAPSVTEITSFTEL